MSGEGEEGSRSRARVSREDGLILRWDWGGRGSKIRGMGGKSTAHTARTAHFIVRVAWRARAYQRYHAATGRGPRYACCIDSRPRRSGFG